MINGLYISNCFFKLKFYLFIEKAEIEAGKERERSSIYWLAPQRLSTNLELKLGQTPRNPNFLGAFAKSWTRSGPASIQTGARMGCWCCRWWLNSLCYDSQPQMLKKN